MWAPERGPLMAVQDAWDGGRRSSYVQAGSEELPEKISDRRLCPHFPSNCVSLLFPQDYLDALTGICYDGIEGLLYLGLFSLLATLAFSTMICVGPQAWKHFTTRWVPRDRWAPAGAGGGSALWLTRQLRTWGRTRQQGPQTFSPNRLAGFLQKLP